MTSVPLLYGILSSSQGITVSGPDIGFYKEFVSFPYEARVDGLHIYPQKLVDGKLVNGTLMKKWGIGKWGEGTIFVPGRKWGEGLWGAGKWDASRTVGGDAWGGYEPMNINLQIKEA